MNLYEIEQMIRYEQGELDTREIVKLFALLIKSGMAWSLQGFYSRAAKQFIDAKLIDNNGVINEQNLTEIIEGV